MLHATHEKRGRYEIKVEDRDHYDDEAHDNIIVVVDNIIC